MNQTIQTEQSSAERAQTTPVPARKEPLAALTWLTQRRLFMVLLLTATGFFATFRETDIDFWWHLKTGEIIAKTGAVPTTDPFSFTVTGQPWVAHEWLWELVVYWLVSSGGFGLAVAASAVIVTLTYGLLFRLLWQSGVNEYVSGLIVLWAAVMGMPSMGVRPRELTGLFIVVFLSRLLLYREGKVQRLWMLPLVMLVWVNVHGPFILGLVLLGTFVFESLVAWLRRRCPFPSHLVLVLVATVAICSVNPAGPSMLLYPFGYYLQGENPSFSEVTEFASPNFHEPFYWPFAASLLLLMVFGRNTNKRWQLADILLVAGFAFQALVSVRHVGVYSIVASPYIALTLCERFAFARRLRPVRSSPLVAAANWLLLLVLPAVVWLTIGQSNLQERLQFRVEPSTESLPVAGTQFIGDNHLPGPIFNHQPWGGYLIYRWYPERKVFIDGRIDMYGSSLVDEYQSVARIKPDWQEILDRYGIQTILIPKDSPLATLLLVHGGWASVFQGEVEEVFVRAQQ